MRRKNLSSFISPASPNAPSTQASLVHERAKKTSVHHCPHETQRLARVGWHPLSPEVRSRTSSGFTLLTSQPESSIPVSGSLQNAPSIRTDYAALCAHEFPRIGGIREIIFYRIIATPHFRVFTTRTTCKHEAREFIWWLAFLMSRAMHAT
jgi:hypothetical protein